MGALRCLAIALLVAASATAFAIPTTTYACQGAYCSQMPSSLVTAIGQQAAPGIVAAAVRTAGGTPAVLAKVAAGQFNYDGWGSAMTNATMFDMASLTKVLITTTAVAQLYQQGFLGLNDRVTTYLAGFGGQGKATIEIQNLLLHNAGFPPDPSPGYNALNCPQNAMYYPAQEFACVPAIYQSLLNQTLVNPVGATFVYSDLSFITLMFVVGRIVQQRFPTITLVQPCMDRGSLVCNHLAYVTKNVLQRYNTPTATFIPSNSEVTPPYWIDTDYHHGLIMGYVSDDNAFALGGVSGHAGLFASIEDAIALMMPWMQPSRGDPLLNATTVQKFITVVNPGQSSRALGWDTNAQSGPPCGTLSPQTFTHTGFTGTQVCGDPVTGVFTVLLGNGRYPNFNRDGMIQYRPVFNSLVRQLFH